MGECYGDYFVDCDGDLILLSHRQGDRYILLAEDNPYIAISDVDAFCEKLREFAGIAQERLNNQELPTGN